MRPTSRSLPLLALALAVTAAQAQIYKCKGADGRTTYQSAPCPNTKPAAAAAAAPVPAPARSNEPYDDPYAPQNASKRPTLVPPPVARSREDSSAQRATTTSTARSAPPTPQERAAQYERDRTTQAMQQDVARLKAQERSNECAHAQQQLGVNREERPIYHYDAAGNKVYTEDKDRAQSLANAQQRVAQACN
jgi:hypothetical protein